MVAEELSLIRFCTMNFFACILSSRPFQPISTLLIKIVNSLIASEPEPDEENKKRLDWIYENTHEKVRENLSVVELAVFKNLDRGLSREIDISDKSYLLVELYKYLDEVALELSMIVISIAKKYSIDIPVQALGGMTSQQQTISI